MYYREGHRRGPCLLYHFKFQPLLTALLLVLLPSTAVHLGAQSPVSPEFKQIEQRAADARQAQQFDDAIALYRKGLQINPGWNEGRWYLGTTLYGLKRYDQARDAFHHLAISQPDNGPAWALAGMSEFELRNYATAMDDLARAQNAGLRQNEDLASLVQFRIALLLNRQGKFEEAVDRLIPFALAVSNEETIEALGLSRLQTQLLPSEVHENDRDLYLLAGKATKAFLTHDTPEASHLFDDLVATYPNHPGVHYARGAFLAQSDPAQALQEFQRELEINPSHTNALMQVTRLYLEQNAADKALPYARRAVKATPGLFTAHRILGESLLETGDASAAIPELQTAAQLAPQDPQTHYLLARAYKRQGNSSLASKELAEFQRLDQIRENQAGIGSSSK